MNKFIAKITKKKVPDSWKVELLDNVAVRGTGHTPNKQHPDYWNGGIKWVSLADSNKLDNRFIYSTDKEISRLGIQNSSAVLHPKGTVILSRDAGVGMSTVLSEEMAVSQHFIAWRCSEKLDNLYLYYWLQFMKAEFERMAVGSTIKTIGMGYFKKMEILLPTIEEQKQIAQILSTWDEAIESQKRLLSLYQVKKEALVQKIYDDTEGLATIKIGDFLSESKIPGTNGELAKKLSVKLYGKGVVKKERNIPGSSQTKYFIRKKGQFIYSKLDFLNGAFGIIPNELDGYESTLDMPAFDIDMQIVDPLFFYYLVSREKFYKEFIGFGKGGRKAKRINQKDFLRTEIKIPSRVVQEKIGNFLRLKTDVIENHNNKYQLLVKQKKGLMQKLLTGKVRVD